MKKIVAWVSIMALLVGISLTGCQIIAPKMTAEEQIQHVMENWSAAMVDKDLDGIMALFSENFTHHNWRDKEGARAFIKDAIDVGNLDGIEVILADAEIKVDGQSATVYPVDLFGTFGSLTMELMLARENGKWLLVGVDAPGL